MLDTFSAECSPLNIPDLNQVDHDKCTEESCSWMVSVPIEMATDTSLYLTQVDTVARERLLVWTFLKKNR